MHGVGVRSSPPEWMVCSDVATCPTCLKVFNKKRNLTRHQKHTLSCSGPRKQLERPQRSPCGGGGIDGHGGLGGDGGDGGGGDDDDTWPAAKLARLAATPAVVAPAYCTKCSRSDRQHDLLFCDGRLCRKAFHGSCLSPALNAATLVGRFVGPCCLVSMWAQMAASTAASATALAAAKASLAAAEEAAAAAAAAAMASTSVASTSAAPRPAVPRRPGHAAADAAPSAGAAPVHASPPPSPEDTASCSTRA